MYVNNLQGNVTITT